MGRDNVIVNRWFSQKERFADLMNGCLFQGQQIILPEQLEKIDRETDLFIPEKPGTEMIQGKGIQRYRDVSKRKIAGDHRRGTGRECRDNQPAGEGISINNKRTSE